MVDEVDLKLKPYFGEAAILKKEVSVEMEEVRRQAEKMLHEAKQQGKKMVDEAEEVVQEMTIPIQKVEKELFLLKEELGPTTIEGF